MLAELLHINKATMVGVLSRLEAQGLVERQPYAADKRALEVDLTEAGREKAEMVARVNCEADLIFFSPLSGDEQKTFHTLLSKLATSQHAPEVTQGERDNDANG